jgi:hypothetical protein
MQLINWHKLKIKEFALMTFHIKLSILALIMGFSIIDVQAAENTNLEQKQTLAKVDVSIDIFPLKGELTIDDYPEILKENKPESSPRFTAIAGEPNSVDISSKELNWNSSGTTRIKFVANNNASKFDLNFEMDKGKIYTIGTATSMEVGQIMLMSANFDNITKLIRVTTTRSDNSTDIKGGLLASNNLQTPIELAESSKDYCASVSVSKVHRDTREKPLRFITHNGEDITYKNVGTEIWASGKKLRIKPGLHHFTATAACVPLNRAKQRTKAINGSSRRWCYAASSKRKTDKEFHGEFDFSINVEAGKRYHLVAQRKMVSETELEHKLSAKIFKITEESCSLSEYEANVKNTRLNR